MSRARGAPKLVTISLGAGKRVILQKGKMARVSFLNQSRSVVMQNQSKYKWLSLPKWKPLQSFAGIISSFTNSVIIVLTQIFMPMALCNFNEGIIK